MQLQALGVYSARVACRVEAVKFTCFYTETLCSQKTLYPVGHFSIYTLNAQKKLLANSV